MNFLVVDDSPLLTNIMASYLRSMGHVCSAITQADKVETWLDLNPCDAVILDIVMPDIDGLSMITIIRKKHPLLPIVIFTGLGFDEETMRAAHAAGANGYVSKGLGPSDIYMALMRVLQKPRPPAA